VRARLERRPGRRSSTRWRRPRTSSRGREDAELGAGISEHVGWAATPATPARGAEHEADRGAHPVAAALRSERARSVASTRTARRCARPRSRATSWSGYKKPTRARSRPRGSSSARRRVAMMAETRRRRGRERLAEADLTITRCRRELVSCGPRGARPGRSADPGATDGRDAVHRAKGREGLRVGAESRAGQRAQLVGANAARPRRGAAAQLEQSSATPTSGSRRRRLARRATGRCARDRRAGRAAMRRSGRRGARGQLAGESPR